MVNFTLNYFQMMLYMSQYKNAAVQENISERIEVNKTSASKERDLCHYCFFKDAAFKFEEHVCNGCHDLLTMTYSVENIAILSAKEATFRCILWGISRKLNNSVLKDKGVL